MTPESEGLTCAQVYSRQADVSAQFIQEKLKYLGKNRNWRVVNCKILKGFKAKTIFINWPPGGDHQRSSGGLCNGITKDLCAPTFARFV